MDLYLYSEIGPDSTMKAIEAIGAKEDLVVHLNSAGGSVYDGLAIYNLLSSIPHKVHVQIEGRADSIASVIAMSGTSSIHETGSMTIHNSRGMIGGTKEVLRKHINIMDNIDRAMLNIYARKTGKGKKVIQALMEKETNFTADEAVSMGLIDSKIIPQKIAAIIDNDKMDNLLTNIQSKFNSLIGVDLDKENKEAADKLKAAADVIAEAKLKEEVKASDNPAEALTAQMVKTTEFTAKMILLDDYIKASMEHTLKAQTFIDKFDAAVKAEVTVQMNALLTEVKSKTEVPVPKTVFTEFEKEQTEKEKYQEQLDAAAERERNRVLKS